ncbi:MAG: hypothetical protein Q9188_006795 [Gyalolechia gomerana]
MSRHKLVKKMALDDELDDFDGADYEDDFDGADEPRLQKGLIEVRAVLGPTVLVSDKDIEDSLWHYYYDVEKTVNYLLEQQAPAQPKKYVKKAKGSLNGNYEGEPNFLYKEILKRTHVAFSTFQKI